MNLNFKKSSNPFGGGSNKNTKKYILIGAAAVVVLLIVGILVVGLLGGGNTKNPEDNQNQVVTNPLDIKKNEMYKVITQDVHIGESKESVIAKVGAKEENIGKNYVVNPNYVRIGKYDFLSSFIFNNDILVAVVHERILDGTQKHSLAVEFQEFSAEIGEYYKLIENKEQWYNTELIYDADTWNDAIVKNNLELYSNFENEETKDYVMIVASGMNYFDFLAEDRENLSVGNLNLIYTSNVYKDEFLGFVSLASAK